MFCLFVVLVELSVLAKWLARKTPLRKPNRGEGIVSRKPRLKSAHDFLGLLYCFIVLLCICVVSCPYVIYYPTVVARYSLICAESAVKPQANKQTTCVYMQIFNFYGGHVTTFWHSSGPISAKCLVTVAKGTSSESRLSIGTIGLGENCFL